MSSTKSTQAHGPATPTAVELLQMVGKALDAVELTDHEQLLDPAGDTELRIPFEENEEINVRVQDPEEDRLYTFEVYATSWSGHHLEEGPSATETGLAEVSDPELVADVVQAVIARRRRAMADEAAAQEPVDPAETREARYRRLHWGPIQLEDGSTHYGPTADDSEPVEHETNPCAEVDPRPSMRLELRPTIARHIVPVADAFVLRGSQPHELARQRLVERQQEEQAAEAELRSTELGGEDA